jgi:hypothetical protein
VRRYCSAACGVQARDCRAVLNRCLGHPLASVTQRYPHRIDQPTTRLRGVAALVFMITLVAYGLSPNVTNGDSYLSFPTAVSITHSADLDLDEFQTELVQNHYGIVERNGSRFDYFPWITAVPFIPVVVALDLAQSIGIGSGADGAVDSDGMGLYQLMVASVVTAVAAALVTVLAGRRSGHIGRANQIVAITVGLAFGLGTAAWSTASRALWQHGPSMALLTGGLLLAIRAERRNTFASYVAIGAVVAAAFTVRPINAVAVVAFAAWCLRRGGRPFAGYAMGGALIAVPWMLISLQSYGELLPPYFTGGRVGWHDEYFEALLANLVSPSRGLLVFAPITALAGIGVVLRLRQHLFDALDGVAVAIFVGYLLIVSGFGETWWAGASIGPRFLTDTLPMLAMLSVAAVDRLVRSDRDEPLGRRRQLVVGGVACLLAWSIAVNAFAATMRATNCWNVQPVNVDQEPGRIWSWSDPQFLSGPRAVLDDGIVNAVRGSKCIDIDVEGG